VNLVQPQVEIRKIVTIVIYRLAHGTSATHMTDLFNLKGSTVKKYVDIVCDALCDKNKLFNNYISIPFGHLQKKIINRFHDLTGLPNICGAINSTHIPFTSFSNKRVALTTSDFFNRKKFHSVVM
jgi:hypothetical protein